MSAMTVFSCQGINRRSNAPVIDRIDSINFYVNLRRGNNTTVKCLAAHNEGLLLTSMYMYHKCAAAITE